VREDFRFWIADCSRISVSSDLDQAQELTLDQLIDRNVQALGGRVAIEAVQSIKFALHIVDPDFEVDAIYYAAQAGRMRIDITAGGKRLYAEAFNGSRAWQWKGKGEPVEV